MLHVRPVHRSLLLLACLLCCCVAIGALHGQEAPLPRPATQDPAPLEPTPSVAPAATPAPPELIPADILPPPDPAVPAPMPDIPTIEQLDEGMKPPPLSPAAEGYRRHVEWRRLRNQVQNDPTVKAAFQKAEAARTDLEKRRLLARYYDLFYRKITAIAPADMKPYLADRKREHLGALPQPRVRPETAPPTPTPAAAAAGSPAPGTSPTPTPPISAVATPSPSPARSLFGLPRP